MGDLKENETHASSKVQLKSQTHTVRELKAELFYPIEKINEHISIGFGESSLWSELMN